MSEAFGSYRAVGIPRLLFTCGICEKYYEIQEGDKPVYEITKHGISGKEAIWFCDTCARTLRNLVLKEQSPKPKVATNKKKRKYIRKCGVCGVKFEQSEMIRTDVSPNGWMCYDCEKWGL